MKTIDFIPSQWLEQSWWAMLDGQKLVCYSRPVEIERRKNERNSLETLLRSILL